MKGTLWRIREDVQHLLWYDLEANVVCRRAEIIHHPDVLVVLDKDDYGNLTVLSRFGVRFTPYINLKSKAFQL